jgi:A/G-specific adenine glycosylase
MQQISTIFTEVLMIWNSQQNFRKMPWKGEKNPYFIWLSEVILQQTRVAQGTAYYNKFITQFPTVFDLANAHEDEVMKAWEGLGYYSRARNLHFAAKQVVVDYHGYFSQSKEELLQLKGVGDYTASAIASFAFNQPEAVVDGNVIRVISRFFGIDTPFDTTEGKKIFRHLATNLIDKQNPAAYNQAIMDFGATVCTPATPSCHECPLANDCKAFKGNMQNVLPIKSKSILKKNRFFTYLDIYHGQHTFIEKRIQNDIWRNLYQLPLIESEKATSVSDAEVVLSIQNILQTDTFKITDTSETFSQILTHQKIEAKFLKIEIKESADSKYEKVLRENLINFAFPKILNLYFEKNTLNLSNKNTKSYVE